MRAHPTFDPLRVPAGTPCIPARYVAGVLKLSRWSNDCGVSTDSGEFIGLRNNALRICETWRDHDWQAAAANVKATKQALEDHRDLKAAISRFRKSMRLSPDGKAGKLLAYSFTSELLPGCAIRMSEHEYRQAVERALAMFQKLAGQSPGRRCRFGPLEYPTPPLRLPRPEIAMATVLADRISFLRKDKHRRGGAWSGSPPVFSSGLPWPAISALACACFDEAVSAIEERGMMGRVRSHAQVVSGVFPFK